MSPLFFGRHLREEIPTLASRKESQIKMGDIWRSKRTFDSPVFPHKCAIKKLCGARAILASTVNAPNSDAPSSGQAPISEQFLGDQFFYLVKSSQ